MLYMISKAGLPQLRQVESELGDVGMVLMPGPGWQNPTCPYALDNGVFHNWQKGRLWGQEMHCEWLQMLGKVPADRPPLWVLLPDAVMDWPRTLELIGIYLPVVRAKGWPVAIALQNGCDFNEVLGFGPDWVFVGGDDDWKEANVGRACEFFHAHQVNVHCGRVNTARRIRLCQSAGVDSVDGTTLNKFRDATLPLVRDTLSQGCLVLV